MKEWGLIIGAVVLVLLVVFGVSYGMRIMNNKATPVRVTEVEPGVRCATMVTTDGAAIDCWKTEP